MNVDWSFKKISRDFQIRNSTPRRLRASQINPLKRGVPMKGFRGIGGSIPTRGWLSETECQCHWLLKKSVALKIGTNQCHWLFLKVTAPECHSECTDSKTKIFFNWDILPFIRHILILDYRLYWYSWSFMNESGTHSFWAGGGAQSSIFWFCSLMWYPLDHGALV